jgi:hypothetical protein
VYRRRGSFRVTAQLADSTTAGASNSGGFLQRWRFALAAGDGALVAFVPSAKLAAYPMAIVTVVMKITYPRGRL